MVKYFPRKACFLINPYNLRCNTYENVNRSAIPTVYCGRV